MKKLNMVLIASLLTFCLLLCSCSMQINSIQEEYKTYDTMYNLTEISSQNLVYVDSENNVMYWYVGHGYGGGLATMLEPDGFPKLYDEANSIYNNVTYLRSCNWIYVDSETSVMYLYIGNGFGGGLATMLEPDGSPKLYDEASSIYNVTYIRSCNLIYVEPETTVMYLYIGNSFGGGLATMLEADGSPKLYDKANSIYNVTYIRSCNLVYVDSENNVMYLYIGHGYGSGLTIMIEADGSPKLYDEANSIYNVTYIRSCNLVYIDCENNVMYWYIGNGFGGGLATMFEKSGSSKVAK